jgi:glutamyl-tRNA synthetase
MPRTLAWRETRAIITARTRRRFAADFTVARPYPDPDMLVRTRFAPSPTGLLHIGGARTALFNYLFARHHGGHFLLRIEDTDRARSTDAATQAILDGLDWLGLARDEQTVFQSARAARHAEVAQAMLAAGTAYHCYLSPAELTAMRAAAVAEGRSLKVVSPWRDRDPREAPADIAPVIRLKAPRDGETILHDLVQGDVRVGNTELDDLIILRADGTPTYLHAVVVDDHDMAITHVIRGDDHLTNSFRQIQIYQANGWKLPKFAHIPLIHGPDGAKLSKRHGAQSVTEFRDMGYVPDGICNYLLRLGWAHGDDEILSRDEAIKLFDLDGVGRAPSRMDYAKLGQVNAVWMRRTDDAWLTAETERRLGAAAPGLAMLMPMLKERAKTLVELADAARFLTVRLPADAKALAALTDDAKALLAALVPELAASDFTIAGIDAVLRAFAEANGKKLGDIAQPLRAALTGRLASPPIDATMAALGRDEVVARIAAAGGR